MRERLRGVSKLEPLDGVFAAWRRLPRGFRAALPVIVVVALAAAYPYDASSLPTDIPVILAFPDVGACVTIIIFVMMAVGLNIVVGYSGSRSRLRRLLRHRRLHDGPPGVPASSEVRFHFVSAGTSKEPTASTSRSGSCCSVRGCSPPSSGCSSALPHYGYAATISQS